MEKMFDESHELRCKLIKSLVNDNAASGLKREMSMIMSCTK